MVRVAVVGLGRLGEQYAALARQDPRTELVGVCDAVPEKADVIAASMGVVGTRRLEDLLNLGPDLVCIATPDHCHAVPAIAAASNGAHLLIEKPLALSSVEAQEIERAVSTNGVKARVAFSNRWNPPFTAANEAVLSGQLGEIVSVYIRLSDTVDVPTRMLSWAAETSPGWFLMSHTADLARWFIGAEAVRVNGVGTKGLLERVYQIDTYDALAAIVQFANGAVAVLESNWIMPASFPMVFDFRMQLVGTHGSLEVDTHKQMIQINTANRHKHLATLDMEMNQRIIGQVAYNFQNFIDCIVEDKIVQSDSRDGLANTKLIEAVHGSAAMGGVTVEIA